MRTNNLVKSVQNQCASNGGCEPPQPNLARYLSEIAGFLISAAFAVVDPDNSKAIGQRSQLKNRAVGGAARLHPVITLSSESRLSGVGRATDGIQA